MVLKDIQQHYANVQYLLNQEIDSFEQPEHSQIDDLEVPSPENQGPKLDIKHIPEQLKTLNQSETPKMKTTEKLEESLEGQKNLDFPVQSFIDKHIDPQYEKGEFEQSPQIKTIEKPMTYSPPSENNRILKKHKYNN